MRRGPAIEAGGFAVRVGVTIRDGGEADLPALEWWGWFTPHREIVRDAFIACRDRRGFFLVAEAQGFPIGQAWVDLERRRSDSCAILWGVRVLPGFQGLGIGRRLIGAAEARVAALGTTAAEISVDKDNREARRLYESLGYALAGERRSIQHYRDHEGVTKAMILDQWVLEKRLSAAAASRVRIGAR